MEYDTIFGANLTAHKDIVKSVRKLALEVRKLPTAGGWRVGVESEGEGGGGCVCRKNTYVPTASGVQKFTGMRVFYNSKFQHRIEQQAMNTLLQQ